MVDTEQAGQPGRLSVRTDVVDGTLVVALTGRSTMRQAAR